MSEGTTLVWAKRCKFAPTPHPRAGEQAVRAAGGAVKALLDEPTPRASIRLPLYNRPPGRGSRSGGSSPESRKLLLDAASTPLPVSQWRPPSRRRPRARNQVWTRVLWRPRQFEGMPMPRPTWRPSISPYGLRRVSKYSVKPHPRSDFRLAQYLGWEQQLSDPDQYLDLNLTSDTCAPSIYVYHLPAICFHNCETSREFFIVNF